MNLWIEPSLINVFKETIKTKNSKKNIRLVTAKNEYESAQIVLRNNEDFMIESVIFTNLKNENNQIERNNLQYNFVEYIYLKGNSQDNIHQVKKGEGYYPEILLNERTYQVKKNETRSIWVKLFISKEVKAGTYTGEIFVNTSVGNYTIDIIVEVNDVTIPDSEDQDAFNFSFWNHNTRDMLENTMGIEMWTPKFWGVMEKMATLLKETRANVFRVYPFELLIEGNSKYENGKFQFDWSKFDEYIEFFMERAGVKYLEANTIIARGIGVATEENELGMNFFEANYLSDVLVEDEKGGLKKEKREIDDSYIEEFYSQYFPQLKAHLKEKGWYDIWLQSIGDEPFHEEHAKRWVSTWEKIQNYDKDLRFISALINNKNIDQFKGKLNVWVPVIGRYSDEPQLYDEIKERDDSEVWLYSIDQIRILIWFIEILYSFIKRT